MFAVLVRLLRGREASEVLSLVIRCGLVGVGKPGHVRAATSEASTCDDLRFVFCLDTKGHLDEDNDGDQKACTLSHHCALVWRKVFVGTAFGTSGLALTAELEGLVVK
jgi:hypothetical protein